MHVFDIAEMPGYTIEAFAGSMSDLEHMTDMGYAIFKAYGGKEGYRLLNWHVYPDAVTNGTGIYMAEHPAVLSDNGKMTDKNTYDVILSANEDLAKIVRHGDDPNEGVVSVIDSGFSMTVFAWKDFAKESKVSTIFYDQEGKIMVVEMPARVSVSKIEDNINIGTVELPDDYARTFLNYMENAPLVELTHPVYGHGTTFKSGYVIRVEYVVRDEYVLHDDMVDCFFWEYNGEYFMDGYKDPENGKHIQQIDAYFYRGLRESVNNLLRWETDNFEVYLSTFDRAPSVLPKSASLYRYLDGVCTQKKTVTDETVVTWLAYALQNPSYMRFDVEFKTYDAMKNRAQDGVQIFLEYGAYAPTVSVECWAISYQGEYYMNGYDYPNDNRDRPLKTSGAFWDMLMDLLS